jgi:hypothetical protein
VISDLSNLLRKTKVSVSADTATTTSTGKPDGITWDSGNSEVETKILTENPLRDQCLASPSLSSPHKLVQEDHDLRRLPSTELSKHPA